MHGWGGRVSYFSFSKRNNVTSGMLSRKVLGRTTDSTATDTIKEYQEYSVLVHLQQLFCVL